VKVVPTQLAWGTVAHWHVPHDPAPGGATALMPQCAPVPTIEVGSQSGNVILVTIHGATTTQHQVDISGRDRFVPASADDATLVRACFEFLLRREPATSIMSRFSLDDIVHYFPEFAGEIGKRLG
jgi:hypothetical protein